MERSVCRSSLAAGILAQLSIIGRRTTLPGPLWRRTQLPGSCGQVHKPSTSGAEQGYSGRTVFRVAVDLPTHFAATMSPLRPRPNQQAPAAASAMMIR